MAALAADQYFGNRGTVTITSSVPADVPIAVIKGISINNKYEHTKLFGMGSINRQAVARHNHEVEVKISYAKFDATYNTMVGALIATSTTDGCTPAVFTVTATAVGDAANNLIATVTNVYFENFPTNLAENDYLVVDLVGYGTAVAYTNV